MVRFGKKWSWYTPVHHDKLKQFQPYRIDISLLRILFFLTNTGHRIPKLYRRLSLGPFKFEFNRDAVGESERGHNKGSEKIYWSEKKVYGVDYIVDIYNYQENTGEKYNREEIIFNVYEQITHAFDPHFDTL